MGLNHQIILLHIGQAGVQVGSAIWELFALEHGIKLNGAISQEYLRCGASSSALAFFNVKTSNPPKFHPRAIFVDTEPNVIDEIRQGCYRKMFYPNCLISGFEDASNIFPKGYQGVGKDVIPEFIEAFRKLYESVDNISSIMFSRSIAGGTGSGTTSLFLDEIRGETLKIPIAEILIYPAPFISTSIVESYNAVLGIGSTMRHIGITLTMDNQALYDICKNKLDLCRPTYFNINHIIAQMLSSMTVSMRYESVVGSDFDIFQTNLIPYPNLKYPIVSYSPIVPASQESESIELKVNELLSTAFSSDNFTVKCFPEFGKYMACALLFRGKDCQVSDINIATRQIKSSAKVNFVDWSPTGFKIALNRKPPVAVQCSGLARSKQALCLIANNTCIVQVLDYLVQKYDLLYRRKAYVHWFTGEGLEEAEFNEAREALRELIKEYMVRSQTG